MSHTVSLSGGRLARRSLFNVLALASALPLGAAVIDFGDVNLATPPATAYAGPGGGVYRNNASFSSGGASFNNSYDSVYGSWSGFAYSTTSDTTTVGYGNQYSAYADANSGTYGVAYYPGSYGAAPAITFDSVVAPQSVSVANITYAALDMLNGTPGFSKKFGGVSGNDADWFKVTFTGYDINGAELDSVDFYLADFDNARTPTDYIVDDWATVDLTGLGSGVKSIQITLNSSDVGMFGINTPTYVAIDNLNFTAVPEPSAAAALAGLGVLGVALLRRRRGADSISA